MKKRKNKKDQPRPFSPKGETSNKFPVGASLPHFNKTAEIHNSPASYPPETGINCCRDIASTTIGYQGKKNIFITRHQIGGGSATVEFFEI